MCREAWRGVSRDAWDCTRGCGQEIEPGERWSEARTVAFHNQTLSEAGRIPQQRVSSGFEEARRKTWAEFAGFLRKVGMGLTVETARGIDIIAFIHGEWIPSHWKNFRTTAGASEEKVASASAIKGVIGHLAKSYSMIGRKNTKNPAKEESVLSYRDGYRKDLHDRGVREKRAKIMKEGKVKDLIQHLEAQK